MDGHGPKRKRCEVTDIARLAARALDDPDRWPDDPKKAVELQRRAAGRPRVPRRRGRAVPLVPDRPDRKSTRLNSSHVSISYAVFCLKKKKRDTTNHKE